MNTETDVLIIGGGAIGVCSAYYLNKEGLAVTLLDKGDVCSGSSYGNAGLIVPSHCVPLATRRVLRNAWKWLFTPDGPIYCKPRLDRDFRKWIVTFSRSCNDDHVRFAMPVLRELSLASVRLFDELNRTEEISFGYSKTGYVRLYNTSNGLCEAAEEVELVKSVGVDAQILTSEQLQELAPNIRIKALGGISYPEDAHLSPSRFVRGLAECLRLRGVKVLPSTEVFDFERSGSTITRVKTTRGDFEAKHIVLSAGSWATGIARRLGIDLPIEGAKGYSFTFKKPNHWPLLPFSLGEAGVAVTSIDDTLRVSGTFAIVGLDFSWNTTRLQQMLQAVPAYLPDLDLSKLELLEVWRGLRPCSPDGLPFLGPTRRCDNLIVAAGHSMIGVSLSPITGKLVSEIVLGKRPSIDISALGVERFQ